MAKINKTGLTPMQLARLEKSLSKQFRTDRGIQTLEAIILTEVPADPAKEITDGMIDWNRRHFNRLDGRQQAEYEARLKAKRYYVLKYDDMMGLHVPKIVFDAVPGRIVKDVDQKAAA